MDDLAIDRLLREVGYGVLSLAAADVPYGIPLSFGFDGHDRLYFAFIESSEAGKKTQFIEDGALGSFLVMDVKNSSAWRSVIVTGPLESVADERWDDARRAMADNASRPDLLTDVFPQQRPQLWALEIEDQSGRQVGSP